MANIKKQRKNRIRKTVFLVAVFVVALAVYFVWTSMNAEKEHTVYTSIEEPTLPVVYAGMEGGFENRLYGYLQDMGNSAADDSLTVLPEDRVLSLRINEYDNMVAKISYEIRSLDLSHFIENTETDAEDIRSENGFLYVDLPIQNLIEKDSQYLLSIHLDIGEKIVNYYTRIIWTDSSLPYEMLAFADNFTKLTFDYEKAAGELVTYLETSQSAKNDDLGYVNINSNFSQLTWGQTGMRLTTDTDVLLKEYQGVMGVVEVRYMTERSDSQGNVERYQVKDSFTMRVGAERIYLLNYERETSQIFEGSRRLFAGKRIMLGISAPDMLQTVRSDDGRHVAFKTDRELWSYDEEKKRAVNIFSFRSGVDDGVRANNDRHDIKILSVSDSGDVDFVVYGYMNRGRHEGYNGIAYYQYSSATDTITEVFFMPLKKTFEHIKNELEKLCVKNDNDMLYLFQNDSVIAVELKSGEMMDIASGLTDVSFAASDDQMKIAWQDSPDGYSRKLQLMDLYTGETEVVEAFEGEYLRLQGFMDRDVIIGFCRESDVRTINGVERGIPMYKLSIRESGFNELKSYEKENVYIESVRTDESRIHLNKLSKTGENSYSYDGEDTIVYKEGENLNNRAGADSTVSETKKKEYFISLTEEIKNTRSIEISVPRKISYENSSNIELPLSDETGIMSFYAYVNGRLVGESNDFMRALDMCYDDIGYVLADNMTAVYNRAAKSGSHSIKDPLNLAEEALRHYDEFTDSTVYDDGIIMLDGLGMNLNQILYYVYEDMPVILRTGGSGGCRLITGYDEFNNIRVFDPETGGEELFGEAEATAFFESFDSDFICPVRQVK